MKKEIYHILVIMALLMVVGCSKDASDDIGNTGDTGTQQSYAPLRLVGAKRVNGVSDWNDIHVFLTSGTTLVEGGFKYNSDTEEWSTRLKLKSGTRTYRLYGFMPDKAALTSSLTSSDDGAVLSIANLNPLTVEDYCVVTGVRQVSLATDKTSATRGNFSFEYQSNRQNYINLLLDHMMSQLEFSMKISTTYNTLRTIKVKKMTLKLANISMMQADITLANSVGISGISYTTTGIEANSCIIGAYSGEDIKTLTTTSTVICNAYVVPATELLNSLELETEFEVYDKKGNKIADRTATNKLTTPLNELERGEKRTLLITVDPTYLYVLSDPDLDNPSMTIN